MTTMMRQLSKPCENMLLRQDEQFRHIGQEQGNKNVCRHIDLRLKRIGRLNVRQAVDGGSLRMHSVIDGHVAN